MDNAGSKLVIACIFILHFIGGFLVLNLPTIPLWQIILVIILDLLLVFSVMVGVAIDRWIVLYIISTINLAALSTINIFSLKQNHQEIPNHLIVGHWIVMSPILFLVGLFIFSILCYLLKPICLLIKNKIDFSNK